MTKHWKHLMEGVYADDIIAMQVPKGEIRGFFRQDIIVNPGEVAVLIRNGKIEDILTQTKLKGFGGGLGGWLERISGKGEDEVLLFIDANVRDLEFGVEQNSKDFVKISGVATLRFKINYEDAPKVLGLIGRKKYLSMEDLENRLQNEFVANILFPEIAKYNSSEFHGNKNIIKGIENSAMVEMKKTFETWGISLEKLWTNWEEGAYDELMKYKKEVEMAEQRKDIDHSTVIGGLRRQHEVRKKEWENYYDIEIGKVAGEETMRTMGTQAQVGRERLEHEEKIRQLDAEKGTEFKYEEKESELAMKMFKEVQEAKIRREKVDQDFKMQQMDKQQSLQEKLLSQAIDKGVADPEVLKEMLRQQTMQKMADRESEKVQAMSEAEKARYNLDTYRSAEDRERKHTVDVLKQSGDMMEKSKQNLPQTLVQGGTQPSVGVGIHTHQQRVEKSKDLNCPNCNEVVKEGWKVCPSCGGKL